jgi:hypothetical protein
MASEPSWRLKLRRAQEHRSEIERLAAPFRQVHEYVVTEHVEHNGNRIYRIRTPLKVDPYMSVIFGDFLFNVRSALDHIAVSLVPAKHQYSASFPIFLIDPEQTHPGDKKGDQARRETWEKCTKGMPARALTVVRDHQPFNAEPPEMFDGFDLKPADTVLAILSAFQNADKHRHLVTAVSGLDPEEVTATNLSSGEQYIIGGPNPLPPMRIAKDGAIVFAGKFEMHVEGKGTADIAAGISKNPIGPYRRILDFMEELVRVAGVICDEIDALP